MNNLLNFFRKKRAKPAKSETVAINVRPGRSLVEGNFDDSYGLPEKPGPRQSPKAETRRPPAPLEALWAKVRKAVPRKKSAQGQLFEEDAVSGPGQMFMHFSLRDQILFAKRLSILVKASIPILSSLKMLEEQSGSRHGAKIIRDLRKQMEAGRSLANGMRCYKKIFGEFAVNIVRVGEMSGTLVQNLNYLADELKKKMELRRSIVSALIYPAFIVAATIAIVIMLTVFLFPKILPVFASFNAQLPWSTRVLIAVSDAAQQYWIHFLVGLFIAIVAFGLLLRIPSFKLFCDRGLLRWPILGGMFKSYYIANSTRTLGLLLKSEVGIMEGLRIVAETSGNSAYRKAFLDISEGVLRGETVGDMMKRDRLLFPLLVPQMVQVGEMTGSLNSSLLYLSEMYEDEMKTATKDLTTSIEPVLMILMGVMVGFVALSIITPIYGITQSLHP